MIYAIIVLIFFLIVLLLLAITREATFEIAAVLNDNELSKNATALAMKLRAHDTVGASPHLSILKFWLSRGYLTITKKIKSDSDLYEFERWIYENYYTVKSLLNKRTYKHFAELPHKSKRARIDIIAEFIIKSTNCMLTKEKVSTVIKTINSHTPLHIDEILNIDKALILALIREVATNSADSYRYERNKKLAKQHKFVSSRLSTMDSYLYWYKKFGKEITDKEIIAKSNINLDNIDYSFSSVLIDKGIKTANAIKSLNFIKEMFSMGELILLSNSHDVLMCNHTYASMDNVSQLDYLIAIQDLSIQYNCSERSVIDAAFSIERKTKKHFGQYLYEKKSIKTELKGEYPNILPQPYSIKTKQFLYLTLIYGITTIASAMLGIITMNIYMGIVIGILSWFALLKPTEFIVQRAHKTIISRRTIPKLNYKKLPDNCKTLVVIPHYIAGKEDLKQAIDGVIKLREGNNGQNISFTLLIDYRKASMPILPEDLEMNTILDNALSNYDDIGYYIRRRTKVGDSYSGHERKRGAIMQMNEMLITGEQSNFSHSMRDISTPEYVIVLDADNVLLPNTVLNAVNTMAHPVNQNYDLLAFNAAYNMYTLDSLYSKQFYFDCGYESYNNYSDYYYNFLAKSIFCGKGIYRLNNFYSKLKGVLPEGRVLSHDIIEGAILNTGRLNDVVFEEAPVSLSSDIARSNRWLRGDVQLLEMIGAKIKNSGNKKIAVAKEPIYGHIMFGNVIKPIGEITMFALLMITLFMPTIAIALPFIMTFLIVAVIQIIDVLLGINKGIRYRYVFKSLLTRLTELVVKFFTLPLMAINNLIVISSTALKLIFSRKKELKWKTYSSTQKNNSLGNYVKMLLPTFGVLLIIALIGFANLLVLGYVAISYAILLSLYVTSAPMKKNAIITPSEREELISYARKTYKFFCSMMQDNPLICDNYQSNPYKGKSQNTSPTNIGLSLISQISAYELGLSDIDETEKTITRVITAVQELEKYKGHLYNWYNIETKTKIEPYYISSVDSGNFIASLITTKEFAHAHGLAISSDISRLIDNMDFQFLYDDNKSLYYIGYNVKNGENAGHYDILASESRLLYYITSAIYKNTKAWNALDRSVIKSCGNTLLSWSGTMFEYLMPRIFMQGSEYSLIENTNRNAITIQQRNKCKNLWGISESGYYAFDNDLNYQYKAFGISEMAKRMDSNRCVITPYATFLALMYKPSNAIINLRKLTQENLIGEFGFYEACDYTKSKNIIYSYMAHHQGMILASICNALCDNVLVNYFNKDPRMDSAKLLLAERKIMSKATQKPKIDFVYDKHFIRDDFDYNVKIDNSIQISTLTNGKYSVVLDNLGLGYSHYDENYINKFAYDKNKYGIIPIFTNSHGEKFSPIAGVHYNPKYEYSAKFGLDECSYVCNCSKMQVFVPHCINGEVRKFTYVNASNTEELIKFNLYIDLAMSRFDDNISHPVFSDMFVSTEIWESENAIIATRKNRGENSKPFYTALVIKGINIVDYESNRYNYIGRNGTIENRNSTKTLNSCGDVLYPCFGITASFKAQANSSTQFAAILVCADNLEQLKSTVYTVREHNYIEYAKESAFVQSLSVVNRELKHNDDVINSRKLACEIMYQAYNNKTLSNYDLPSLFGKFMLNGLIKTLLIDYDNNTDTVERICGIVNYLNICSIRVNLIIAYKEHDLYYKTAFNKLSKYENQYCKIVDCNFIDNGTRSCMFKIIQTIDFLDIFKSSISHNISIIDSAGTGSALNSPLHSKIREIILPSGNGGITKNSYVVTSRPMLPYSNVICGQNGGMINTENGGGYFYNHNSRELKITNWVNDPVADTPSERIYLVEDGAAVRINCLINGYTEFNCESKYVNSFNGIDTSVSSFIMHDGIIRGYEINIKNNLKKSRSIDILFDCDIVGYWKSTPDYMVYEKVDGYIKATNTLSKTAIYYTALGDMYTCNVEYNRLYNGFGISEGSKSIRVRSTISENQSNVYYIVISSDLNELKKVTLANIKLLRNNTLEYFDTLGKIKIKTEDKYLDALFNNLMKQIVSSRINGRCGYYQAGGAIGFRDQLQDSLAALYSDTASVRKHIIEVAEKQFLEGDVLHWWHPPYQGVRTRISDDKLFLPYVVCEYIKFTNDTEILNEKISYLQGELLNTGEESRFCKYEPSSYKETLLQHCKRAIDSALDFGEHGLCKIGAGDWNDALNGIGLKERGESVWLTMFLYMVIDNFIQLLPSNERIKYLEIMDNLRLAIDETFNGGWFKRAFTDDGKWLGNSDSEVCKIDLLCQSFAVIADCCDHKNARIAMKNANEQLVDKENGIIKLLTPPFDSDNYAGYISSYPKGVRENGGQYTHSAIWYIIALTKLGEYQKAYDMFSMINPMQKCATEEGNHQYMGEPYVLAGDVYANGRMGWSWYTGSASWAYKAILENLIGFKIEGNAIKLSPHYIKGMGNVRVELKWKQSKYNIDFICNGKKNIIIDHINFKNTDFIPLYDENKTYNVVVEY